MQRLKLLKKMDDFKMYSSIYRLMENGVQSRTSRRILASPPDCGPNVAMFAAVSIDDMAPAFRILLCMYGVATSLVILEIVGHARKFDVILLYLFISFLIRM